MNEPAMIKKKMLLPFLVPIEPPFADNSARFSGVFPGSSPDLIGPAPAFYAIASCIFLYFSAALALFCLLKGRSESQSRDELQERWQGEV